MLHIVSTSDDTILDQLTQTVSEDDHVVFLSEVVPAKKMKMAIDLLETQSIYVIGSHRHESHFNTISYEDLTHLCAKHNPIQTWY